MKAALFTLLLASAALAEGDAYNPPASSQPSQLQINGYADIGFAAAAGNGTVVIQPDGTLLYYAPDANYTGPDTITYTVTVNATGNDTQTITLTDTECPLTSTATPVLGDANTTLAGFQIVATGAQSYEFTCTTPATTSTADVLNTASIVFAAIPDSAHVRMSRSQPGSAH